MCPSGPVMHVHKQFFRRGRLRPCHPRRHRDSCRSFKPVLGPLRSKAGVDVSLGRSAVSMRILASSACMSGAPGQRPRRTVCGEPPTSRPSSPSPDDQQLSWYIECTASGSRSSATVRLALTLQKEIMNACLYLDAPRVPGACMRIFDLRQVGVSVHLFLAL